MSEESANFYRIISLVVDVGTKLLTDTLFHQAGIPDQTDSEVILKLGSWLQSNYLQLQTLKGKGLNKHQFNVVNSSYPDLSQFDISVLTALLCNICPGVQEPQNGWSKPLAPGDESLGADLVRLRTLRNEITAHCTNAKIETGRFKVLWDESQQILIRIATPMGISKVTEVVKEISEVQYKALDPRGTREQELLSLFQKSCAEELQKFIEEIESLKELQLKANNAPQDVVDGVESRVTRLENELRGTATHETPVQVGAASQGTNSELQNRLHVLEAQTQEILQLVQKGQCNPAQVAGPGSMVNYGPVYQAIHQPFTVPQQPASATWAPVLAAGGQPGVPVPGTGDQPGAPALRAGGQPDGSIDDRELEKICREEFGLDWEAVGYNLDYTSKQIQRLKSASSQYDERIRMMVKRWHDVVVQCNENPRELLAAAFASMDNNMSAVNVLKPLPFHEGIASLRAGPNTIEKIKQIDWSESSNMGTVNPGYYTVMTDAAGCMFPPGHRFYPPQQAYSIQMGHQQLALAGQLQSGQGMPAGQLQLNPTAVPVGHIQPAPGMIPTGQLPTHDRCRGEGMNIVDGANRFKTHTDTTMDQARAEIIVGHMSFVGALICSGGVAGTVFRVGSKYVMTAAHVVAAITDCPRTKQRDYSCLEHESVFINFNADPVSPQVRIFRVKGPAAFINWDLDIAVLEVSNPEGLPPRFLLSKEVVGDYELPGAAFIGYGHPGKREKHLEPQGKIIPQSSNEITNAQKYFEENRVEYQNDLRRCGANPNQVEYAYKDIHNRDKMCFSIFMEKGASGAPAICVRDPREVYVVAVLTHGLPCFLWDLPQQVRSKYPERHRFEMGARMSSIYKCIAEENSFLALDLFGPRQ